MPTRQCGPGESPHLGMGIKGLKPKSDDGPEIDRPQVQLQNESLKLFKRGVPGWLSRVSRLSVSP